MQQAVRVRLIVGQFYQKRQRRSRKKEDEAPFLKTLMLVFVTIFDSEREVLVFATHVFVIITATSSSRGSSRRAGDVLCVDRASHRKKLLSVTLHREGLLRPNLQ